MGIVEKAGQGSRSEVNSSLTRIALNTDADIPSRISYSPLSLVWIISLSREEENILAMRERG